MNALTNAQGQSTKTLTYRSWHTDNKATIWRCRAAYQNHFSTHMDWTIEANHPPVPKLKHTQRITAKVGDRVNLSAQGSTNPDGNPLSYQWFYYGKPSTFTLSTATTGDWF